MKDYLEKLPKPFFVLAPMDDVTDTVFRRVVADCSPPDLFFTEFVSVDGLQSPGRRRLAKKLLHTSDSEKPLIAQIWGKQPENYRKTTKELVEQGFAGVDLNMGCPVKAVVKNGCCSALIMNQPLADDIIEATRLGLSGRLPLSVKTRLGFKEVDLSWIEFLLAKKLNMLTIHLRTAKEMSKVPAHFEYLKDIIALRDKIAPETMIVANGDINSRAEGLKIYEKYGVDGIMIGRGIFHDPFVFSETDKWSGFSPLQKADLFANHVKLFKSVWENGERPIVTLNKFCKIYINGFDGAKDLREELMHAKDADDLLKKLEIIKRSLR